VISSTSQKGTISSQTMAPWSTTPSARPVRAAGEDADDEGRQQEGEQSRVGEIPVHAQKG
jgi:hypothetical protein